MASLGRLLRRVWNRGPEAPPDDGVVAVLRASGLFDGQRYSALRPDLGSEDPVAHYVRRGAAEGADPNPFFDTDWYLDANPDVRAAGMNPLLHYVMTGEAEGRQAGPAFDGAYYASLYPEVVRSGASPLLHYLRHGRAEGRVTVPHDATDAFETGRRSRSLGETGPAEALFRGVRAERVHYPLAPPSGAASAGGGLPLPPSDLAARIGSVTLEDFDASGRDIRDAIVRSLPEGFSFDGARVLDFGCGVGRVLRHFAPEAGLCEFWGCDVDGKSVRWAAQHLLPFRIIQVGEVPTLPFEDDSFDLVYAVSVLSHVHDGWQQWLAEIRRILRPGGVLLATFLGPASMTGMLGESHRDRGPDFGLLVEGPYHSWEDGGPMIFPSLEWIRRFWCPVFDVDWVSLDGLMGDQSIALMRKPARGAPIRRDFPIVGQDA